MSVSGFDLLLQAAKSIENTSVRPKSNIISSKAVEQQNESTSGFHLVSLAADGTDNFTASTKTVEQQYVHQNESTSGFHLVSPASEGNHNFKARPEIHPSSSKAVEQQQQLCWNCHIKQHAQHDHPYTLSPKSKLNKEKIKKLQYENKLLKIKLGAIKKRRSSTRFKYKQIIKNFKQNLSTNAFDYVDGRFHTVLEGMLKIKKEQRSYRNYSEGEKQLALTLHFYSPKAYDYLRKHVNLPHPGTLNRWLKPLKCNAGPINESLLFLEKTSSINYKNLKRPTIVNLVLDEMAIRSATEFDGRQFVGGIDLGHGPSEDDTMPLATEALFFMAVAVNGEWKVPLGYVLVNHLAGKEKAQLVLFYIEKIIAAGCICLNITCDGASSNFGMFKHLDINIVNPSVNYKNWLTVNNQKIFIFLDPSHMLKLMRNLLANKECIVDGMTKGKICWKFIKKLNELQNNQGLHLANKLRTKHINFQDQKMKVKLAAQTLSASVAGALEFCQKSSIEGFEDAGATVQFLRMIDELFDILNSRSPFQKGIKAAICPQNIMMKKKFLISAKNILLNLEDITGQKLIHGQRRVGVLGFVADISSLISMVDDYLICPDPPLKYILTYKLSQDHLEIYFSTIRSKLGHNTNPTPLQLKYTVRKTLAARITTLPSISANCIPQDNVFLPLLIPSDQCSKQSDFEEFDHTYVHAYSSLSVYTENVTEYIAGFVVRKVRSKINCENCLKCLYSDTSANETNLTFIKFKDKGGLVKPSKEVIKLCLWGEKVLRSHTGLKPSPERQLKTKLINQVLHNVHDFDFCRLRNNYSKDKIENHSLTVSKLILDSYFELRLHHIAKMYTADKKGVSIRQKFNKLILFKGH